MCRSLAEGGRRCPHSHSGPSGRRLPRVSAELQRQNGDTLTYRIRHDRGADMPYRVIEEARAADGKIAVDDSVRCATRDEAESAVVRYVAIAQTELGYRGTRGPAVRESARVASGGRSEVPADVDSAVRTRYRELAREPGDWVPIRTLREALPDVPREQLDASLGRLFAEQRVNLVPRSFGRSRMTDDDRAASYQIGGESKDLISIQDD